PAQTRRAAPTDSRPAGQTRTRNAAAPIRSASEANTPNRATAYRKPTVLSPPWLARSRWVRLCRFPAAAPFPTWNVNAPLAGGASAEITRHAATHEAASRVGAGD